jgi:sugar/nucleoside kinase (ribokinase family)
LAHDPGTLSRVTDVLVVGDANPDLILRGDVVPRFGQAEQLLTAADLVIGGSAGIVAHGLARLGRSTSLAAAIGQDAFGDLMAQLLATGGVATGPLVRHPDRSTGVTVVLSATGDRAILTFPGAIPTLSPDQAREAMERAADEGARHLHVASFFLQPDLAAGLPSLLEGAQARGLTTSLDTNFDPAQRWDGVEAVLPHLDVLLPNRAETLALAALVGHGRTDDDPTTDLEAAARLLSARGPVVVVKDGPCGALRVDPLGDVLREPGTRVDPVDTTGAGDTFDAAYLDSMLRGLDPPECLRRACLAGALCTSGVGGTAAQPTLDQLALPAPDSAPGRASDAPRHP